MYHYRTPKTRAEPVIFYGRRVDTVPSWHFFCTALSCREAIIMPRYGKKAQSKVKRAMHERKHGTLRSGRSGKRVTSRKQAIAIGLSEARREGAKVPRRKGSKKR